jgi:hypothetical protein
MLSCLHLVHKLVFDFVFLFFIQGLTMYFRWYFHKYLDRQFNIQNKLYGQWKTIIELFEHGMVNILTFDFIKPFPDLLHDNVVNYFFSLLLIGHSFWAFFAFLLMAKLSTCVIIMDYDYTIFHVFAFSCSSLSTTLNRKNLFH